MCILWKDMIWYGSIYLNSFTQENTMDLHSLAGGLLATGKGRSALRSVKYCQGQL
jgi:hypothetical protein